MLFDIRGRRRRAIQATYVVLAVLLGGGLVLFGVGSDVGGGLLGGGHGGGAGGHGGGSVDIDDQIERAESTLVTDPKSRPALESLIRARFAAASAAAEGDGGHGGAPTITDESEEHLRAAADAWGEYRSNVGPPDPGIAGIAVQALTSLGDPAAAASAQAVVARAQPGPGTFANLAILYELAGDRQRGAQAADRALRSAPSSERDSLRAQLEAARTQALGAGGSPAGAPGGHGGP